MLGAIQDASVVYRYGKVVGDQCKRMGIQVNYAPVMDVNNPDNPLSTIVLLEKINIKLLRYSVYERNGGCWCNVMR
jgi:hypothetical protein